MKTSDKATATGSVSLDFHQLRIKFSYDPAVIAKVKTLSQRAWDSNTKTWTAALIMPNVEKLIEWGFSLDKSVRDWRESHRAKKELPVINFGPSLDWALKDFQKEGVRKIEAFRGRALLADDPGLGKTPQCLAWVKLNPAIRPVVIVTKKSGKLVWRRIAKRGIQVNDEYVPLLPNDRVQVIYGDYPLPTIPCPYCKEEKQEKAVFCTSCHGTRSIANPIKPEEIYGDVVIINYDILARPHECPDCSGNGDRGGIPCRTCNGKGEITRLRDDIAAMNAPLVILDEPQQISNRSAQRTIATLELTQSPEYLIAATASPIKNRPKEFFNILNRLRPDIFHSFWNYAQEFCGATHNGYGWNFNGASNLDKLNEILTEHVMIRRLKNDILGDLPLEKHVIPLEIRNKEEYQYASEEFMRWLKSRGGVERFNRAERAEALVRISTLMRMAAERKADMVIEWITDFLESEQKLIVFTMHTNLLERILNAFPKISVRLDGSSSSKQREEAEDKFQNDPRIRLFVGNSDAAGDTITLTAAKDVAFAELPKTPEDIKQNIGRAFGRMNDPHGVNVWFLVAADSIEEDRAEQLNTKARVVSQVLDGINPEEGDDLIELLSKYK
jgi:SNF2 family DNA or RNA helicase